MRNICNICGYEMDSATCVDQRGVAPKAGDFSICFRCGAVFVFTADLTLRDPDEEEWEVINTDVMINTCIALIKRLSEE